MIINFLKEILAPKKCYSCKKEGTFLCENCFYKQRNFNSICYICKKSSKNFLIHKDCKKQSSYKFYLDNIIILTHYKNFVIKKLIEDFKFYFKKDVSSDLSIFLAKKFKQNCFGNKNDYLIVYPPMTFFKKIIRGYNPSEILAKNLGKILDIKVEKNLFKKIKNTREQKFLSRQQRLSNLKNSFKINKNKVDKITGKNIIIVDDIISTGATINELAKILKNHNPKKIIGLLIASD